MQSTGHSPTHALSFTSMQGSAITYAMVSIPPWRAYPQGPRSETGFPEAFGSIVSEMEASPTVASLLTGTPVPDAPGGTLTIHDPARLDQVVAHASLGDAETFVEACRRANAAQPGWASVPAPVRGRAIQQLGRLVEDNAEALARLITHEIGKPIRESRGEVQEVVDTCTFFLGEGRRLYGQTVPSEMPDKQLFTFRAPVGACAIVTAGNFPVAVPSWYIVPALLCGNTVVWKPAEYTPATAEAFARLILHAGFPAGTFQLVLADGPETFAGMERALEVGVLDKVGFTGSSEVGRRIGELCGRNLQSPCLELGGKNPLVVMPDADLDLAVEGALFSGFGTSGQRCTSLGTAIVRERPDQFERPARRVRWRSRRRSLLPPDDRRRGHDRGRPRDDRDVRPDRRGRLVRHVRRGDGACERPRVRPVEQHLHARSAARVPVPRAHLRRHGERQQFNVGCGSAPAVRRQRPGGQREPAG